MVTPRTRVLYKFELFDLATHSDKVERRILGVEDFVDLQNELNQVSELLFLDRHAERTCREADTAISTFSIVQRTYLPAQSLLPTNAETGNRASLFPSQK
jgi:hypothetical protein